MHKSENCIRCVTPQVLAGSAAAVQLIANAQRIVGARCLHTDFEVSSSTYAAENAEEVRYAVLFADETAKVASAVLGAEYAVDLKRAWLRGPFVAQGALGDDGASAGATAVFEALRDELGDRVNVWDAYVETTHQLAIAWYQSHGFVEKARHSVYSVSRGDAHVVEQQGVEPPTNDAMITAIVALAQESFPGGYLTRSQFAAPPSDEAATLALVADGVLLGYVYVSYEAGAIEAHVDNLAVATHARRRGVGRKLLNAALHWAFQIRNAPQAALVVREGNTNATALYESVGFRLVAEGVHLQLR
jgi:ribosomal protein S18 acetylase RimI-like enzyme